MTQPQPDRWPPQRRIINPEDADERLSDFGMTVEVIRQSIEAGDTARQRVMPDIIRRHFRGPPCGPRPWLHGDVRC